MANDALVTIGAARYSVPVAYVGQTVSVQESTEHYEIFHRARLIARHPKAAGYSVVMEPAHYAGLLRAGGRPSPGSPPRFDPYFGGFGEVMVRDLALYEATIIAAILSAKKVSQDSASRLRVTLSTISITSRVWTFSSSSLALMPSPSIVIQ